MKNNEQLEDDKRICRALITPSDENTEYDFECVAVPNENGQVKFNYREDEYFMQILKAERNNINTERLESGLPLFDNHPYDTSAMKTLGISVSYDFDERGLVLRCKFGSRADEALRNDVKNGIIKTVSIEGQIQNYSVERKVGEIPKYYAEMWTPESISFAPVPNDIGSQIEVKRAIQKQITPEKENKYKTLVNKF